MVLQQFGGVNAIVFYASEIFISAGNVTELIALSDIPLFLLPEDEVTREITRGILY